MLSLIVSCRTPPKNRYAFKKVVENRNVNLSKQSRGRHFITTKAFRKFEKNPEPTTMKLLYDTIFRRTSTYFVGIAASVFFFERAFDLGSEAIFDSVNRGVSYIIQSGQDVH